MPGGQSFAGSAGMLDADGRAQAILSLPDSAWASMVWVRLAGLANTVTSAVGGR